MSEQVSTISFHFSVPDLLVSGKVREDFIEQDLTSLLVKGLDFKFTTEPLIRVVDAFDSDFINWDDREESSTYVFQYLITDSDLQKLLSQPTLLNVDGVIFLPDYIASISVESKSSFDEFTD